MCLVHWYFDGILPKGPYPPCLRMTDRALLVGYPRFVRRVYSWDILYTGVENNSESRFFFLHLLWYHCCYTDHEIHVDETDLWSILVWGCFLTCEDQFQTGVALIPWSGIIMGMGSANETTIHRNVVCHWLSFTQNDSLIYIASRPKYVRIKYIQHLSIEFEYIILPWCWYLFIYECVHDIIDSLLMRSYIFIHRRYHVWSQKVKKDKGVRSSTTKLYSSPLGLSDPLGERKPILMIVSTAEKRFHNILQIMKILKSITETHRNL